MTEKYTMSWYQKVTIPVPSWWRERLGVKLKTVSKYIRPSVSFSSEIQNPKFSVPVRNVQIEETSAPTLYIPADKEDPV